MSSTTLTVGGRVTVSGGGCTAGHIGSALLGQDPSAGPQVTYNYGEQLGQTDVAPDGQWKIDSTLPAMIIGPATIRSNCSDPSTGATEFIYSSVAVNVATPYHLQVEPGTTVRAGTTLTVSSVGGGCDSVSNPDVYLWSAAQPNALTGIGEVVGPTGIEGQWHVNLTVPTTTAPGQYQVVARCEYSRSYRITYEPVPLTVAAG